MCWMKPDRWGATQEAAGSASDLVYRTTGAGVLPGRAD